MKPEVLWLLLGLFVFKGSAEAPDYGEEVKKEKPGVCPPPLLKKLHAPLMCGSACTEDADCGGRQKCCESGCGGHVCRMPPQEKPGKCPRKQRVKPSGEEATYDTCAHDWECKGAEKCCFSGTSMRCIDVHQGTRAGSSRPEAPAPSVS
ncbi:waprin-Phi1-like isoform X2 [Rhineura floridana]|uniref:waprin-Phi1-like isoform X2 n=1 Tax=Rhineura floridana TaxID=261503 RepID=UPI002AC7FFC7|nr:waprin-Phi1-like isoform X2 [Rhineura floridana]